MQKSAEVEGTKSDNSGGSNQIKFALLRRRLSSRGGEEELLNFQLSVDDAASPAKRVNEGERRPNLLVETLSRG